jgi:plasmid maintenance system killer protein
LVVDGKIYQPPVQFTWDRYSRHEFMPLNEVVYDDNGARFIFNQWNDLSKDVKRSITVDYDSDGNASIQYIAYFDKQYRLLIIDGDNSREEWYNANISTTITVDKVRDIDGRSRLILSSWSSSDPNIPLSDGNSITVVMDRSIVLKPIWKKQYYINVKAIDIYGNALDNIITIGSGWYDEGSKAHLACIPLTNNNNNNSSSSSKSLLFYSWRVLNAIRSPDMDYRDRDGITTITVDAPYTLECIFIQHDESTRGSTDKEQLIPSKLHRLTVLTSYGALIRDELVESNSIVKIDAQYIIPVSNDTRYVFMQWNDGLLRNNASNMVKVYNDDKIIVAEYKKQYKIEVNGNTYGWYDDGSRVEIKCPMPKSSNEVKYEFVSWSIDNSNNNNDNVGLEDSSKESISITVNRPYKLSCSWKELYYVSIISPYREVKGEGLYEKGTQAVIYASEQIDLGLGKRAYFAGWQGDINDKSNILSITVDKPYKIVAVWNEDSTQQYIVLAILSMSVISASIMYIKGKIK